MAVTTPPELDEIELTRGDSQEWTERISDGTSDEKTPRDLTGHTFLCQIRTGRERDSDVIATVDVEVVGDQTDADLRGWVELALTVTEADKLPKHGAKLWMDLQMTWTEDLEQKRKTLWQQPIKVRGDASHV